MPTDPNLDAVLQGILGGVGAGLAERKRQTSPEAIGQAVDVKTRMVELDEAYQRIRNAREKAKFDMNDYESRQNALKNMRASGEFGMRLANLIESQTTQPSGDVQGAYLGIDRKPSSGEDYIRLFEYAKGRGYAGELPQFLKEIKSNPSQQTPKGGTTKPPLTNLQARTAIKEKAKSRIKELEQQENEWVSPTEYRALSPEKKAEFRGPVTSPEALDAGTPYYRPRPEITDAIKQIKAYLNDETQIKRGVDSFLQIWSNQPGTAGAPGAAVGANQDSAAHPEWYQPAEAPDFSTMTPQDAYDQMKTMGITGLEGADPNDPAMVEYLRYYMENPDAFNK